MKHGDCRLCALDQQKARYRRLHPVRKAGRPRGYRYTRCKLGKGPHDKTPANTNPNGSCRPCLRAWIAANKADRNQRKRTRRKQDFQPASRPNKDQQIEWERILDAHGLAMKAGLEGWKLFYGWEERRIPDSV